MKSNENDVMLLLISCCVATQTLRTNPLSGNVQNTDNKASDPKKDIPCIIGGTNGQTKRTPTLKVGTALESNRVINARAETQTSP